MLTTILAYCLVILFTATEGRLRKGQPAQTLQADASDRKSTRRLGMVYSLIVLSLLLAPVLNYLEVGRIAGAGAGWAGLIVALGGIALRVWATQVLGEFYTRTLRVAESQPVVQSGPYHLIRHPGYLGSILMWAGAGLATTNWIALAVALAAGLIGYHYRIEAEEAMLVDCLGQSYIRYKTRTWRLIPFIY